MFSRLSSAAPLRCAAASDIAIVCPIAMMCNSSHSETMAYVPSSDVPSAFLFNTGPALKSIG
ncbi:hypothetical protein NECAME_00699 [Necator americanus]|uniref:Uncharacterized protein n=1 Tax=Necator americanus TaxID=51031 RepID=W2SYC2_NECAM|nr:hypothetical protein NECAME_00699 [Necator americanus]ETN73612.1 hypothetical protein NECAME_00699 [Necator americanus]